MDVINDSKNGSTAKKMESENDSYEGDNESDVEDIEEKSSSDDEEQECSVFDNLQFVY